MADFYRKERPEIFEDRFKKQDNGHWKLVGNIIFQAKAYPDGRTLTVKVNNVAATYKCTVNGAVLSLQKSAGGSVQGPVMKITETDLKTLLSERSGTTPQHLAAHFLAKQHATSSSSSPLISGCIENNFKNATTYESQNLRLVLKTRVPVANPYVSGLEKEYFLIGQVKDTNCSAITYCGTNKTTVEEIVDLAAENQDAANA